MSTFRDFHVASSLGEATGATEPSAETTAAERRALEDPGKRYGIGPYELPLPGAAPLAGVTLEAALERRRSTRDFVDRAVPFEQLGAVLGTYRRSAELALPQGSLALRTAASAGGLYPVELYLLATKVAGLARGLYHYRPSERALAAVRPDDGEADTALQSLILDPQQAESAAGAIVLSARFDRSAGKYGERGYRYILVEAGEIAQTLALGAAAVGVGMVGHGAFYDDRANRLLGIDGFTESVLVILLFGVVESKPRLERWRSSRSAHT